MASGGSAPFQPIAPAASSQTPRKAGGNACWLEVCAPFIVEDAQLGVSTEIILTSDTFTGQRGHEDPASATDYEILLYDASGSPVGTGGMAKKLTVQALRTTVIPVRALIGSRDRFWGGMKIRLRPQGGLHASDLFSSAFVRWLTKDSFDNVHANPDPRQWQNTKSYFYSMPFPSLSDYDCVFSLFNPNQETSAGKIVCRDHDGRVFGEQRYELKPHTSLAFNLNSGTSVDEPWARATARKHAGAGLLAIINDEGRAKGFGYLMIRAHDRERFSVEHPIHQGMISPRPAPEPFDAEGQFKARNVLYTPLLFREAKLGGVTFESRCYFGSGLSIEDAQWFYPFATDSQGEAVWSTAKDERAQPLFPHRQFKRGVIRLGSGESCSIDFTRLSLKPGFSGGLGVAVSPDTSHTLLKLELRVPAWGAHAFTHFRPGLRSARLYQKPAERGGLVSDYIVSGARLFAGKGSSQYDEIVGVINIDDQGIEAEPTLELFGQRGLLARLPLGKVPPFACRHYVLSNLVGKPVEWDQLTMRLVDDRAVLLMSAVHLDYARREIALDHGSDRFSTFLDYDCS